MAGTAFDPDDWSGYDETTVTNPGSALDDFTLLIDISTLSSSLKAAVQSDGADLRATKGDGVTELPIGLHEWAYNAGAPTGWIMVKWSGTLAASGTQQVRIWAGYDPGTATAYDADETYGRQNTLDSCIALWPLGGTADYSPSGATLSIEQGTPGTATGVIGTASEFAAESYGVTDTDLDEGDPLSISTWVRSDNDSQNSVGIISKWNGDWVLWTVSTSIRLGIDGSHSRITAGNDEDLYDGDWHHLSAVIADDGTAYLYMDGVELDSQGTFPITSPSTDPVTIGSYGGAGYWTGEQNWARIDAAERSEAWFDHDIAQVTDQATFWGTWSWTSTGGGGGAVPTPYYWENTHHEHEALRALGRGDRVMAEAA